MLQCSRGTVATMWLINTALFVDECIRLFYFSYQNVIIVTDWRRLPMDAPWREVLLDNRDAIVCSADTHDALLNRVLDYLLLKWCIQLDQNVAIKFERHPRDRFRKLLDFLSSESCTVFDKLCNAFRAFDTDDKVQLADKLQQDLRKFLCSVFKYKG